MVQGNGAFICRKDGVIAAYFETTPQRSYDNYDSWYVPDREGKQWRIMSDGSIRAEWNDDQIYYRNPAKEKENLGNDL